MAVEDDVAEPEPEPVPVDELELVDMTESGKRGREDEGKRGRGALGDEEATSALGRDVAHSALGAVQLRGHLSVLHPHGLCKLLAPPQCSRARPPPQHPPSSAHPVIPRAQTWARRGCCPALARRESLAGAAASQSAARDFPAPDPLRVRWDGDPPPPPLLREGTRLHRHPRRPPTRARPRRRYANVWEHSQKPPQRSQPRRRTRPPAPAVLAELCGLRFLTGAVPIQE